MKLGLCLSLCLASCLAIPSFNGDPEIGSSFGSYDVLKGIYQEPPPPTPVDGLVDAIGVYYVQQKLDHFDKKNNLTWEMVQYILFLSDLHLIQYFNDIILEIFYKW